MLYARRCDNGQGSSFVFKGSEVEGRSIDVTYSTFWNDFSHYSFYGEPSAESPAIEFAPLAYNQLVGQASEDMLFADKEKYIDEQSTHKAFFDF